MLLKNKIKKIKRICPYDGTVVFNKTSMINLVSSISYTLFGFLGLNDNMRNVLVYKNPVRFMAAACGGTV